MYRSANAGGSELAIEKVEAGRVKQNMSVYHTHKCIVVHLQVVAGYSHDV